MKLYGGIDLHGNNNVIALLDEADRVVFRKRLDNDFGIIVSHSGLTGKTLSASRSNRLTTGTGLWMG